MAATKKPKSTFSDGEEPQPAPDQDPTKTPPTPSELAPETAHGHSPQIAWPQVGGEKPYKGLK